VDQVASSGRSVDPRRALRSVGSSGDVREVVLGTSKAVLVVVLLLSVMIPLKKKKKHFIIILNKIDDARRNRRLSL
jgi:hypothetical protein